MTTFIKVSVSNLFYDWDLLFTASFINGRRAVFSGFPSDSFCFCNAHLVSSFWLGIKSELKDTCIL